MGLSNTFNETATQHPKVAILVSGNGTNLQAIINAWQKTQETALLSLVISNRPNAYALTRSAEAGIAHEVIDHTLFEDRASFDRALSHRLKEAGIDLIVLAGFMRILSDEFLNEWMGKVINIHPSLLPAYRGLNTHQRVLSDQCQHHGCTVHWVVPELDAGPIISQAKLRIEPEDDAPKLQERVQALEHLLYPITIAWIMHHLELPVDVSVNSTEAQMKVFDVASLQTHFDQWYDAGSLSFSLS